MNFNIVYTQYILRCNSFWVGFMKRVSFVTKLFYGFGSIAYGAKSNGLNYFLLIYYNQVLGLPVSWVGTILLVALLIDAISDPIMGYVSDNWHSNWGRRHPFMYASILPAGLIYFFLWNPPTDLTEIGLYWWALSLTITTRLVATIYETPSTSLAPDLTEDYHERTELLSYRYAFGWFGGASMAIISYLFLFKPNEVYSVGQLNPAGYQTMGLVGACVIMFAILISALGTHKHIPTLKPAPAKKAFGVKRVFSELFETLSNRSFIVIFVSAVFMSIASGISISMTLHMMTYFWQFEAAQLGYLTILNIFSALIALFIAPFLSKRLGKKLAAIIIAASAFAILPSPVLLKILGFFPDGEMTYPVFAVFFLIDISLIITSSILIASMIADLVEDSEIKTGRRSEGVFFASQTFVTKALIGVGVFVTTLLLAFIEFPKNAKPGLVDENIIQNLGSVYILALWIFYGLGIISLCFYKIDETKHKQNLEVLQNRTNS